MTEDEIRLLNEIMAGGQNYDTGVLGGIRYNLPTGPVSVPPSISEVPDIAGLTASQQKMRGILREREEQKEAETRKAEEERFREFSLAQRLASIPEAAAMFGTTIPASVVAPVAKEVFGTPEAEFTERFTYMPRTDAGLARAASWGEIIGRAAEAVGESAVGQALSPIVEKIPGIFPVSAATVKAFDVGPRAVAQGAKLAADLPRVPFMPELLPLYSMPTMMTRATKEVPKTSLQVAEPVKQSDRALLRSNNIKPFDMSSAGGKGTAFQTAKGLLDWSELKSELGVPDDVVAAAKKIATQPVSGGKPNLSVPTTAPTDLTGTIAPVQYAQLPDGKFATTTAFSNVKTINVGFDTASNPDQVAHITAGLRKSPQEQILGVVVDENDKPLQIIRHSIGTRTSSMAEPAIFAGSIANVPGAKSYWIVHNHPSKTASLSDADIRLSSAINQLTAGTGIENRGILAIAGNKYASYEHPSNFQQYDKKIPPAPRNKPLEIVEREFRRTSVLDPTDLSSEAKARRVSQQISGGETGLVLINNAERPVAFLPIKESDISSLRQTGTAKRLLGGMEKANANTGFFISQKNVSNDDLNNLYHFFEQAGGHLKDAFVGKNAESRIQKLPTSRVLYRGAVPIGLGASAMEEEEEQKFSTGGSAREVPTASNFIIDEFMRRQEEEEAAKRAAEMSSKPLLEKGKGALEAAQTTASAIGRGLLNPFFELGGQLFGRQGLGKDLMKSTPIPKSEMGQFYMGNVGDVLGEVGRLAQRAKVPDTPFMPELLSIANAPLMAVPAASKAAKDVSKGVSKTVREEFEAAPVGAIQIQPTAPKSDLGLYSNAEQAVLNLKQNKGTGNQFLAQITNTPGVKPAELEWTGLADFLKSKGNQPVTKSEVADYLATNKVQVNEKQLLEPEDFERKINNEAFGYTDYSAQLNNGELDFYVTVRTGRDTETDEPIDFYDLPQYAQDALNEFQNKYGLAKYGPSNLFNDMVLPNGENYREILLTLPKTKTEYDKFVEYVNQKYKKDTPRSKWDVKDNITYEKLVTQSDSWANINFNSPHFDEPNIIAHIRVDDRFDADGNKVLFVEELQSDWGQSGRNKGFASKNIEAQLKEGEERLRLLREKIKGISNRMQVVERVSPEWEMLSRERELLQDQQDKEIDWGNNLYDLRRSGIPSAPFVSTQKYRVVKNGEELITKNKQGKDVLHIYDNPEDAAAAAKRFGGEVQDMGMQESTEDWVNLSIKRLITDAVNNNYKKVAFINGQQSADRYDLSKSVKRIGWTSVDDDPITRKSVRDVTIDLDNTYLYLTTDNNGKILNVPDGSKETKDRFIGKGLDEVIGKDLAQKIIADKDGSLSGEGLQIGGEGMKKFYDQIIPNTVNKLLKKLGGGKLETVKLEDGLEQIGFTITPEMRELVKGGLPLFAKGGSVSMKKGGSPLDAVIQAGKKAKAASDAKRREERVQQNLEKYMGTKDKPKTLYHATQATDDFSVFDLERRPHPAAAKAVFVTPSPQWASEWIDADMKMLEKTGVPKPRLMPVITRAKNPFDYENPTHVNDVLNRISMPGAFSREHVAEQIGEGNWNFIEDRKVQQAIKDLGFDSFYVQERGMKNLGVFDPTDVKSLFNRGSYDPTTQDISKRQGGLACL